MWKPSGDVRNHSTDMQLKRAAACGRRHGKIVVLVALMLPAAFGVMGLVVDGSLLMMSVRQLQDVADAARDRRSDGTDARPTRRPARRALPCRMCRRKNGLSDASVQVNTPCSSGPFAGVSGTTEVVVTRHISMCFIQIVGCQNPQTVTVRSVAQYENATQGAAIVVLDPDPPGLSVPVLPITLPAVPAIFGGLQVLGLGQLRVQGAVLVNTNWGGLSQKNLVVGQAPYPPRRSPARPCSDLHRWPARICVSSAESTIRITTSISSPGGSTPLNAGRLPVLDPLLSLPVPTVSADSTNVQPTAYGGMTVIGLPLGLGLSTILRPGVYDYIEIVSGSVTFEPGVYIIRSVNPVTGIGLSMLAKSKPTA